MIVRWLPTLIRVPFLSRLSLIGECGLLYLLRWSVLTVRVFRVHLVHIDVSCLLLLAGLND